jgi:hypothetical protein
MCDVGTVRTDIPFNGIDRKPLEPPPVIEITLEDNDPYK